MTVTAQLTVALSPLAGSDPQPAGHAAASGPLQDGAAADVGSALGPTGMLLLLALAVFAGYVLSLSLHPNAKCNRCKGAGRHRGSLFNYATRPCTSCKGRGTHPRLGRRVLFKQG